MPRTVPRNVDAAMRYATGDLPVLSAEMYDPGDGSITPEDAATRNKDPRSAARDGRKKRKVLSPSADPEQPEEDDKKKMRGRPRLETKDETAAEVTSRRLFYFGSTPF